MSVYNFAKFYWFVIDIVLSNFDLDVNLSWQEGWNIDVIQAVL